MLKGRVSAVAGPCQEQQLIFSGIPLPWVGTAQCFNNRQLKETDVFQGGSYQREIWGLGQRE